MPTLYHYTTPAGFEGILKSKSIWVTDTRYLNDREEFRTGWDIFREVLKSNTERLKADHLEAYQWIRGAVEGIDQTTAYVASFSQNGDVLSQWRGYNGGYGFSLGFCNQDLHSAAQGQDFELCPVAYERTQHYQAMHAKFELLYSMLNAEAGHLKTGMLQWWLNIIRTVIVLKNEHFREEAEVRLSYRGEAMPDELMVRPTARALIPYVQMKLTESAHMLQAPTNLGLREVIVGPAMADNQVIAAEYLLRQHGIEVPVRRSEIPYIGQ